MAFRSDLKAVVCCGNMRVEVIATGSLSDQSDVRGLLPSSSSWVKKRRGRAGHLLAQDHHHPTTDRLRAR